MSLFSIKQIDKIIVKTFLFYFFSIWGITVFISLMSVFYQYMQIIIDKNLGFDVYFRIILNCALIFSLLGCNMAVIIAAVFCFVKLSEGLEICAMKTFGVSFNRILKSLLVPISGIILFTTFASHYLCPKSMKNTVDLLMDIQRLNPAVMIKKGIFNNDIPGISIFVKEKTENNELKNVIVYDHSQSHKNISSNTLLLAENANLDINKNDNSMTLKMKNGINYLSSEGNNTEQSVRMYFDNQDILFDINKMRNRNTSQAVQMKTTLDIIKIIKSNNDIINNNLKQIIKYIEKNRSDLFENKDPISKDKLKKKIIKSIKSDKFNDKIIDNSTDIKRGKYKSFDAIRGSNRKIKYYNLIIYDRIIESLACILFLILGVSIGVLLKRGSFFFHIVLSLFFVALYYTAVSIKSNFISNSFFMLFLGILLLLPFTIFFYIHASRDSQILNEGFDKVLYLGRFLLNKLKFKFKKNS